MYLNCIVDTKGYHSKPPKAEIKGISYRLATGKELNIPLDNFKQHLEQGKTYIAGHYKDISRGRTKGNFENINFFSLDVDNHYKDKEGKDVYTNYTEQDTINKVKELLNITPMLSYQTFSKYNKTNNSKRFRLVYGIDSYCTSEEIEQVLKYITLMSGDIFDKSATDSSRLFFSTNGKVKSYKDYKLLDNYIIDELAQYIEVEEQEQIKQVYNKVAKKMTSTTPLKSDVAIEQLKEIDISNYLIEQGYTDIKKTSKGYKMPCPIHKGVNDNFSISQVNGIYLYKCFSKCGGKGGSLIDLHMNLNNISESQAIQELKQMYNIKTAQDTDRKKESYTIDKYISKDLQATTGIMEAIDKYSKVLITGSMGTGKTHFILNDVYNYSKEKDKTLIVVIPNVSQLINLNNNKGIPIVCQDMPVYMGDNRVATTPESLPKITKEVGKGNYILVVDESHERYTSSGYRRGYRNNNIEEAEKEAYKSIHLTATPRLLVFDNFDIEINIKSRSVISNNVEVIKVKNKMNDNMLSIADKEIKAGRKVVIFNNNIEDNETLKELLEEKKTVSVREYKTGQIDLLNDDPLEYTKEETIIKAETVKSGSIPESIAKGSIEADVTLTTSSIQAGIDLYTEPNTTLIVNTDKGTPDAITQLIGRFRKGIKVKLINRDREKQEVFDLEYITEIALQEAQALADSLNNGERKGKTSIELIEAGMKEKANIEKVNGKWEVQKNQVIRKVYENWSNAVLSDTKEFIRVLEEQEAFKVENITVTEYNDILETRASDIKEVTKEQRKEKIKETTEILLNLTDKELDKALHEDYTGLETEPIEAIETYKKIAHRHMDSIRRTRKHLFTDDVGIYDTVGAFRHFYSNTWADIKREIKQKEVKETNRNIKEQGKNHLLSKEALRYRTAQDVRQAKIREELKELEKKQGRLSNKIIEDLRDTLIKEKFIVNKYTKTLANDELKQKDKEKALKCLGDIVRAELGYIYNITDERISSIKL